MSQTASIERLASRPVRFANEIIVVAVAMVSFLIVWPVGEYAILDDWAFAKSLEHLHFEGRLVILDWNPMTLIGHLLWGLLFTKVLGFSFFATKVAAFCAGVVLVIFVERFVRSHGVSPTISLLAALSLLLNPLFLAHIFMYMTDVTGLTWQWLSLGALGVAMRRSGRSSVWWATSSSLCWGLATLTRQHGVAIPLALAAYLVLFERSQLRRFGLVASAFLPGMAVSVVGLIWQRMSQETTDALQVMTKAAFEFVTTPPWFDLPYIVWSYAVYAGLFAAPMCFAIGFRGMTPLKSWRLAVVLVGGTVGLNLFVSYTLRGWYFPYIRNVITPWGMFGPNVFVTQEQTAPVWALEWGIVIGLAGLLSAIWFLAVLVRIHAPVPPSKNEGVMSVEWHRAWRLLLLLLAFQVAYALATAPFLFDRHLLLFAPTVISLAALAAPTGVRPRRFVPSVALVVYAVYGIVCTHDIHAVSRAVFLEGTRLVQNGVDSGQIDAGYAFDGWFMYERSAEVITPPLVQIHPWWPSSYPLPQLRSYSAPWWIGSLATQVRPGYVITAAARAPTHQFEGRLRFEELEGEQRFQTYWPWKVHQVRVYRAHLVAESPGSAPST